MEIRNKVAIVTGAGGPGCGRAIARRLAAEGAKVVVSDIDEAGGRETVRLIVASGGKATFLGADVGVEDELMLLLAFAKSTYGSLDILVNNASAPYRPDAPLQHWQQTLQVDLIGAMNATRMALDVMRERGGAIVHVGSTSAIGHGRKHSKAPAYDVAKMGVMRLTTTLAFLREKGIRVNCVVPDWVATPLVKKHWSALTPAQREADDVPEKLTTVDEIASTVVRLVSDDALAGRIAVQWSGEPARLVPAVDPGYTWLEDLG